MSLQERPVEKTYHFQIHLKGVSDRVEKLTRLIEKQVGVLHVDLFELPAKNTAKFEAVIEVNNAQAKIIEPVI